MGGLIEPFVVLQALPAGDYILDDGAKFDSCSLVQSPLDLMQSPLDLVQNPLDQTDTFSSNDENDVDEETMYVPYLVLGRYSLTEGK